MRILPHELLIVAASLPPFLALSQEFQKLLQKKSKKPFDMALQMGLADRANGAAEGTPASGHSQTAVINAPNANTERSLLLFGPRTSEVVQEMSSAMRPFGTETAQAGLQDVMQHVQDLIIRPIETTEDFVEAIYPRGQADGFNLEWMTTEINNHTALIEPEGAPFHIMTHRRERRVLTMVRVGIGAEAHNDALKEEVTASIFREKLANIPSTVIRAERLMALAHMIRLPGTLKRILDFQGVKMYETVADALRDSIHFVGIAHAEKGIEQLWSKLKSEIQFQHIIAPKGAPEQIIFSNNFESEYIRTGKRAHTVLKDPERHLRSTLQGNPKIWVLDPTLERDVAPEHIDPLGRTLRFGEYAQIDGSALLRQQVNPKGLSTLNALSVQIVDVRSGEWATLQYEQALRASGRWDLGDGRNGYPLSPKHYDFQERGFAHYVRQKYMNALQMNKADADGNSTAHAWGDPYFWRSGSPGNSMTITSDGVSAEKMESLLPCKMWGDQDLSYRTLEFDERHVHQSAALLSSSMLEKDYINFEEWNLLAKELDNPAISSAEHAALFADYVKKFSETDEALKLPLHPDIAGLPGLLGPPGTIAQDFETQLYTSMVAVPRGAVMIDAPYGLGSAWGMRILADDNLLSQKFGGWKIMPKFVRAHEIASAAWESMRKFFAFIRNVYPGSLKFLRDNAREWFADMSLGMSDLQQIQMMELFASDKSHLPTYVKSAAPAAFTESYKASVIEKYRTDASMKQKLAYAAKFISNAPNWIAPLFTSPAHTTGDSALDEHLINSMEELLQHDFFSPDFESFLTNVGEFTISYESQFADFLSKHHLNAVDLLPRITRSRTPALADVRRALDRTVLLYFLTKDLVKPDEGHNVKEYLEIYVNRRAEAYERLSKKRTRSGGADERAPSAFGGAAAAAAAVAAAAPPAAAMGYRMTPLSFSIEWWKSIMSNDRIGGLRNTIAVGDPRNPKVPLFYPEHPTVAHRPVLELDARGRFTAEDYGEEMRHRKFSEQLQKRPKDSFPLGHAAPMDSFRDLIELEDLSDTYHYLDIVFDPHADVFWRHAPGEPVFHEVGTLVARLQNARRCFASSTFNLAIARAFLFSRMTLQSVLSIAHAGGIPPILSILFMRPFAEIYTKALIFANPSGRLLSKHADLMPGVSVDSKIWKWHYTEWKGIAQIDMKTIVIRPDAILNGYGRGLNSMLFPPTWKAESEDNSSLFDQPYSYFTADCGANFSRGDLAARAHPIATTGRYNESRFMTEVRLSDIETRNLHNPPMPHYPGNNWLVWQHQLELLDEPRSKAPDTFYELKMEQFHDGLCWAGTQRIWSEGTKGYSEDLPGNGVMRDWKPHGIKDRLNGQMPLVFSGMRD